MRPNAMEPGDLKPFKASVDHIGTKGETIQTVSENEPKVL